MRCAVARGVRCTRPTSEYSIRAGSFARSCASSKPRRLRCRQESKDGPSLSREAEEEGTTLLYSSSAENVCLRIDHRLACAIFFKYYSGARKSRQDSSRARHENERVDTDVASS